MKNIISFRTAICLSILLFIFGCSLAPKYKRPAFIPSETWPKGEAYRYKDTNAGGKGSADIAWKSFFLDENLQKVIGLALENNRDLRIAALNVEKTRALYRIRRAEQFPSINGQASGSSQKIPASLSPTGNEYIARQYNLNVGILAYELDFFGRVKSLKASALEQFLATEHARSSAQISLISEIAQTWLTLSADKERLKLAKDTFDAQKSSYEIIRHRFKAGASSELALRQAESRMEAARLDMARYTGIVAQDKNMLNLLAGTGIPDNLLPDILAVTDREDNIIKKAIAGLPSSVLLNRPDILAAERELRSVNARIGAARAAFFPRITLTGTFGIAGNELNGLFDQGSVWSFMPQISIPLFTAGKNKANLKATKVERDIAVARYEKSIQNAFREVADALAVNGTIDAQIKAREALLKATSESYRLSGLRYEKGIDSYLTLLDAQRSLYSARQSMINTRLMKLAGRVTLYKVLGGGS